MPKCLAKIARQAFVMIPHIPFPLLVNAAVYGAEEVDAFPASRGERGDTLIEVVISAALISLVVIAVLFGLDSTNRATASSRARSASGCAGSSRTRSGCAANRSRNSANWNGAKKRSYRGDHLHDQDDQPEYHADATGTASCTSSIADRGLPADGIRSHMALDGSPRSRDRDRCHKPAGRLGPDRAGRGTRAPHWQAQLWSPKGPAPSSSAHELETSVNGCAILALPPGEYTINVSKTGYVDVNGFANTFKDEGGGVTKSRLSACGDHPRRRATTWVERASEGQFYRSCGKTKTTAEGDSFVALQRTLECSDTGNSLKHQGTVRNIRSER